ncbi:MAG: BatD family protein [Neptuniibacter sp.]
MILVRVFSFLAFLILSVQAYAAVTSQVDRKNLQQGETFLLVLNITGSDASSIDLSPLEKDFEVLGRNHRSNTSIINGDLKRSTKLLITLAPKASGTLEVPVLTVAGEQSQPITINVAPVQLASAVDGGVELLSSLSDKAPLVQQPLIYQVNIVLGQRIFNAEFVEPKVKQGKALIQPLGEQRQYRQQLQGRDILVVEQSWVVTPQQSGVLEIESAKLSTSIQKQQTRFPGSSNPRSMQRIFLSADNYLLDVEPIPATFSGASWITASELTLKTELSSDEWKVGDPVTQTLTLNAIGTTQEQITELELPEVQGIKQYPTKPVYEQDFQDGAVRLQMTLEVTLIPNLAGEVTLPEIRLPWWNTETNLEEVAVLPEQSFNVSQGDAPVIQQNAQAATNNPTAIPSPVANQPMDAKSTSPQMDNGVDQAETEPGVWDKAAWLIVGLALLMGALLGGVVTFYLSRKNPTSKTEPEIVPVTQSFSMSDLKTACQKNDAVAAREALAAWAQHSFPESRQLNAVLGKVSPELREAITELNRCCYSAEPGKWNGKELVRLVEGFQPEVRAGKESRLVGLVPG